MKMDFTEIFCHIDDFLKELDAKTNFITDRDNKPGCKSRLNRKGNIQAYILQIQLSQQFAITNKPQAIVYSSELLKAVHDVIAGIGMVNLLHYNSTNDQSIPLDYRIYDKDTDDKTKNDHFCEMQAKAKDKNN